MRSGKYVKLSLENENGVGTNKCQNSKIKMQIIIAINFPTIFKVLEEF